MDTNKVEGPESFDVNEIVTALMNPTIRKNTLNKLDEEIQNRKAELDSLLSVRADLGGGKPQTRTPVKRKAPQETENRSAGRPTGPGADHGGAIQRALKGTKGFSLGDLHARLEKAGHPMKRRVLATYIINMQKKGTLVKDGEHGKYVYKLADS